MCDQHCACEEISARCSAYEPVSSVFAEGLSSRTRRGTTAWTLNADWAGDGGTILAAMQARHWCEMVIGLVVGLELSLSADMEVAPGS